MDDLEATRLCAVAMAPNGFVAVGSNRRADTVWVGSSPHVDLVQYDPLHDDAHAMALVKRFQLPMVWGDHSINGPTWYVGDHPNHEDADLNRAIVYCVAKMRADAANGGPK